MRRIEESIAPSPASQEARLAGSRGLVFISFPRLRGHSQFHPLALTNYDDFDWLADLHGIQRVSVIVDIFDLLAAEFDDDIPAFESRLFPRAAAAHPTQLYALDLGRVIGDRAQVGAQLFTPATPGLAMHDLQIIGPLGSAQEIEDNVAREFGDALHALVVNFAGLVGGTVIVLVAAREKMHHRDALRIKRRHV